MSSSIPADFGRIFISYRREETAYPAGWLFDRLVAHFGKGQIFKDIDAIKPGGIIHSSHFGFLRSETLAVGATESFPQFHRQR